MGPSTTYYVTDIPDIPSTTRYQHSLAIGEYSDQSSLLTHSDPPREICDLYDNVYILDGNPASRVYQATRITNSLNESDRSKFITAGQYEPILAGYLSSQRWVCDIYDDPLQGLLNHPRSYHQIFSRVRQQLIPNADIRIYTIHPRHSRIYDGDGVTRYAINGAPTAAFDATILDFKPPMRFIQAGKTKLGEGLGIVLSALAEVSIPFVFDIYGEKNPPLQNFVKKQGLGSQVHIHGRTPHTKVREAVQDAHFGFCVLGDRADWKYHYPIKAGEYLAAGTIPVLSRFPGICEIAKTAGLYAEPNKESLVKLLNHELTISQQTYRKRAKNARRRAEAICWENEREWFYQQTTVC